jgi:hypothetical protein
LGRTLDGLAALLVGGRLGPRTLGVRLLARTLEGDPGGQGGRRQHDQAYEQLPKSQRVGSTAVVTSRSTGAIRWVGRRSSREEAMTYRPLMGVLIVVIAILMVWKPGE